MRKILFVLAALALPALALAAPPAVVGPDQAYLKWSCVTQFTDNKPIAAGAVSYQIARRVAAGTWATIASPTGTAAACVDGFVDFLDTKLAKATYEWNVRAVVGTNKSDASPSASKIVAGAPPPSTTPKPPGTLTIEVFNATAQIRGALDTIEAVVKAADPVPTADESVEQPATVAQAR